MFGQLIQRYGIAVSECSIALPWRGPTAVDESALGTSPIRRPATAIRWRSTTTAAALSGFEPGPHRRVATTKTLQRVAEARSTADAGGRIVMWPGCSTSHMAMWPHEDARRFARMDPHGVTARPPCGCDSLVRARRRLPAARRTPTYRAPSHRAAANSTEPARSAAIGSRGSTLTRAAALAGPHRHVATPKATQRTPHDRSATAAESRAERDCA